jgi:hypothetical protein
MKKATYDSKKLKLLLEKINKKERRIHRNGSIALNHQNYKDS